MDKQTNARWWNFAIEPERRGGNLDGDGAIPPPDYRSYLGLDSLLASQQPTSPVPEERVFIITHQLFELAFKQTIFDLAVIATTLQRVLDHAASPEATFAAVTGDDERWQPALTAAARALYASQTLLPAILGYLSKDEARDDTFSGAEFHRFRANLTPSSGFQTAQFRLMQRALGKANLFTIRLYPGAEFYRHYAQQTDGAPLAITDPLILRQDAAVAQPDPADLPLALVARLDDLVHATLARLPAFSEAAPDAPGVPLIADRQTDHLTAVYGDLLARHYSGDASPALRVFGDDLRAAVARENARRQGLAAALAGMRYLHAVALHAPLLRIITRLIAADDALHDPHSEASFLAHHMKMAVDRLKEVQDYAHALGEPEPPQGTGGGGVEYLGAMRKLLIPLFPALVACRPVVNAPVALAGLAFQ